MPARTFLARLLQDEPADGTDEPGRFSDRDEHDRRNIASHRMPPPQQRLGAGDVVADQTDDRLKLQRQLAAVQGAAQISFAEIVFENGDTQVVDFNDKTHARGVYSFLDFKDGRKVDHVRVVAKADSERSEISLHMVS
jgi:hypothetical protein